MILSKTFSENLKRIRKIKGITQTHLSQLTGISCRMLSYYEKHAFRPPIEKVEIIAKALSIQVSQLLENTENLNNEIQSAETLEYVNPKTIIQLKKILKLNQENRAAVYKMVNALLKEQEQKLTDKSKSPQ